MDDIDDSLEVAFLADRKRERHDRACKARRRGLESVSKIGVFLIDLVYDHKTRQKKFIRVLPRLFRLDLDAVNCVDYD